MTDTTNKFDYFEIMVLTLGGMHKAATKAIQAHLDTLPVVGSKVYKMKSVYVDPEGL